MMAAPTPWSARCTMSSASLRARPQPTEKMEHGEADQEEPLAPIAVAEGPPHHDERREGEHVSVDGPLERTRRHPQPALNGGQRHVDDGVVEQDHPLPDAHGEKGQPAAPRVERSRGETHAEWAAPAVPSRTASRHSRFNGRMGGMGTTVGSGVAGATASLRSVAAPFFMNKL